jgi:hypothetical protein
MRRLTRKFAVLSVIDSDTQTGTIPFGVVDQPRGLAPEVFIDRVQRVPQLARRHPLRALAVLAFEDMHDLADPLEAALGILRLMAQSLGLSQGAVHGYVARARRAGVSWLLPERSR